MNREYSCIMLSELINNLQEELKTGDKYVGFEDENSYTSKFKIKITEDEDIIFIV